MTEFWDEFFSIWNVVNSDVVFEAREHEGTFHVQIGQIF